MAVAPLRLRPLDVGPLARQFCALYARRLQVADDGVIDEQHLRFIDDGAAPPAWPGNAAQGTPQEEIARQLQRLFAAPDASLYAELEKLIVRVAFAHTRWHQVRTAGLLGVTRNTLRTLLTRHDLLR